MRFSDNLPVDHTRQDLDRIIQMAMSRLCLSVGLELSPDRMAIIIQNMQGRGFGVRQLENALIELAVCPKFDDKLRYGGTLTATDILEKAKELGPVATDPVRAMLNREKRQAQLERGEERLLPESTESKSERFRRMDEEDAARTKRDLETFADELRSQINPNQNQP